MPRRRSSIARKRITPGKNRIREASAAYNAVPVDVRELRRLSRQDGGFYNATTRSKAWLSLLGARFDDAKLADSESKHDAMRQVELDVVRSLWQYPEHCADPVQASEQRKVLRDRLSCIINTVLATFPDLHYYQGFHDVVSVLMLTFHNDDDAVFAAMKRLVRCHLKDYMAADMKPTLERLKLVLILIDINDKELGNHLRRAGLEPSFAISWVITWFAHEVESLDELQRLFDFLLASHPLMVLYLSAAVVHQHREDVLEVECEFTEVYKAVTRLKRFDVEAAIAQAWAWFEETSPQQLLKRSRLTREQRAMARGDAMDRYPAFLRSIECQRPEARVDFVDFASSQPSWLPLARTVLITAVEVTAIAATTAATLWFTTSIDYG
eukprot:TRINITY_DN12306_c0_g1_i5.p1 TRINITY_DN12306_c0_g1~~TRINITY_DN12306_c0_g1_i5.p1  ORF type:complete len:382 (+),score=68.62 TRINITY_DN12306_c0_g1_i5:169-1314(+)